MLKSKGVDKFDWRLELDAVRTNMEIQPVSVPSQALTVASGASGSISGVLTRHDGFCLMESMCRLPMRPDLWTYADDDPRVLPQEQWIAISARRVRDALAAGGRVFYEMFPFEVTNHDDGEVAFAANVPARIKGWVVRMENVLNFPSGTGGGPFGAYRDESANDIEFPEESPILALIILADERTTGPRPATWSADATSSDFRLILPLQPRTRTPYQRKDDASGSAISYDGTFTWRAGNNTSGTDFVEHTNVQVLAGFEHYKDDDFDELGFHGGGAAVTGLDTDPEPIYAENEIRVVSNNRFIYVFSTTGEFDPVTIWFDLNYGRECVSRDPDNGDDPDEYDAGGPDFPVPLNYLMSTRSPGFHWEPFGVNLLPELDNIFASDLRADYTAYGAGSGYLIRGEFHKLGLQWFDPYRSRWSRLSEPTTFEVPSPTGTRGIAQFVSHRSPGGDTGWGATEAAKAEVCFHYPQYRLWCTIGGTEPGGQFRLAAQFWGRNKNPWHRALCYLAGITASDTTYSGDSPFACELGSNLGTAAGLGIDVDEDEFGQIANASPPTGSSFYTFRDFTTASSASLGTSRAFDNFYYEPSKEDPSEVISGTFYQGITVLGVRDDRGGEVSNVDVNGSAPSWPPIVSTTTTADEVLKTVVSPRVVLRWSSTVETGPEVFPEGNRYVTELTTDAPFALVNTGDFVYALGNGIVHRMQRSGSSMAITEAGRGYHLASPWAAIDVRGTLFAVFRDGLYMIEPNSGTPQPLDAINRIMSEIWPDQLDQLQLGYDTQTNNLYVLNRDNGSMVILWLGEGRVTQLPGSDVRWLTNITYNNTNRLVLVTETGRFLYPRFYEEELEDIGSYTYNGWINDDLSLIPSRTFRFTVTSATYDAGEDVTAVVFSAPAYPFLFRDNTNFFCTFPVTATIGGVVVDYADYYWHGTSMYNLTEGNNHGTRYKVDWVAYKNIGGLAGYLMLEGNQTSTITSGTVLSWSPIPLELCFGALEDTGSSIDGALLRIVDAMGVVVPHITGDAAPTGIPTFELGVVDYTSHKHVEPQNSNGEWFQANTTTLQRDRRVFVPAGGGAVDTDDPASLIQAFRVSKTGHILFPYLRCFHTNLRMELKEVVVEGKITMSKTTVR